MYPACSEISYSKMLGDTDECLENIDKYIASDFLCKAFAIRILLSNQGRR